MKLDREFKFKGVGDTLVCYGTVIGWGSDINHVPVGGDRGAKFIVRIFAMVRRLTQRETIKNHSIFSKEICHAPCDFRRANDNVFATYRGDEHKIVFAPIGSGNATDFAPTQM